MPSTNRCSLTPCNYPHDKRTVRAMAARKNKPLHDEKTKDKIRATQLVNFLTSAALRAKKGKSVDQGRIAAAKAVLPFLKPALSSVEQTIVDDRDKADPAELAQRLAAMFDQKPELFEQVVALRTAAIEKQSAQASAQHSVKH